ncbi:PGPGW domain-containing protein [Parvularcula marina]|uniref:PGPGW domain-containing protein n=1 Tax=Parvularcula marina TaxID=2292771 RepID=UPI003513C5E0
MEPFAASFLALIHKLVGSILVLFGIVVLPTPIPGILLIAIGLALLAPYFRSVQKLVRFIRRKSPMVDRNMVRFKDRCPKVIRTTIEKTNPHLHPEQS